MIDLENHKGYLDLLEIDIRRAMSDFMGRSWAFKCKALGVDIETDRELLEKSLNDLVEACHRYANTFGLKLERDGNQEQ